jgi:hypothetical protein
MTIVNACEYAIRTTGTGPSSCSIGVRSEKISAMESIVPGRQCGDDSLLALHAARNKFEAPRRAKRILIDRKSAQINKG